MSEIESLNILLSICFGLAVMLVWLGFYPENLNFLMKRISDEQDYELTQLEITGTLFSKVLLPLAQKFIPYTAKYIKKDQLIKAEKQLKLAGSPFNIKAMEFINLKFAYMCLFMGCGLVFGILDILPLGGALLGGIIVGLLMPTVWINSLIRQRSTQIEAELPNILDLISVCMSSGMTLLSTLNIVCSKNKGLFIKELEKVELDIKSGSSIKQAFFEMSQRCNSKKIEELYQNIRLSEDLGTPISDNLKIMADAVRQDTFEAIKQKAAKAATLVLFPTLIFIFPSIIIILAGPMVPSFMNF